MNPAVHLRQPGRGRHVVTLDQRALDPTCGAPHHTWIPEGKDEDA